MKIISKYKDYYDFLIGVYGEDEKIVLDRRVFKTPKLYTKESYKFTLFLCGLKIDGLHKGDSFYYGENLRQFERKITNWYLKFYEKSKNFISIECENSRYKYENFNTEPIIDKSNINIKNKCPIILLYESTQYNFPILSNIGLQSFLSPDKIYQMLYEWLSNRITAKENRTDNRTDIEKLLSKGFDKKISFRGK